MRLHLFLVFEGVGLAFWHHSSFVMIINMTSLWWSDHIIWMDYFVVVLSLSVMCIFYPNLRGMESWTSSEHQNDQDGHMLLGILSSYFINKNNNQFHLVLMVGLTRFAIMVIGGLWWCWTNGYLSLVVSPSLHSLCLWPEWSPVAGLEGRIGCSRIFRLVQCVCVGTWTPRKAAQCVTMC